VFLRKVDYTLVTTEPETMASKNRMFRTIRSVSVHFQTHVICC